MKCLQCVVSRRRAKLDEAETNERAPLLIEDQKIGCVATRFLL